MSQKFEEGQRVRPKPREGTVEMVKPIHIYPKSQKRDPVYSYLVRWDDGTADTFGERELEVLGDEQ